jgi:hypothetical protein
MKDWNGREIQIARSKGGVLAALDPLDNLIRPAGMPWPPAEIVQKLYQSRQESAFDGLDAIAATCRLGYYCDLQSLRSEDAITWSVFGTVRHAEPQLRRQWLRDLLALFGLPDASPSDADPSLWRRMPHPDTLGPGGPEIDFAILADELIVLGEAKWRSAVGSGQGRHKDKDQIQLRGELLAKFGQQLFPGRTTYAVVGVGLEPGALADTTPDGILFGAATWEQLCALPSHPCADEVQRYFQWKKTHGT